MTDEQLRQQILELTAEWSLRKHAAQRPGDNDDKPKFIAGKTPIPYAARTFTEEEVVAGKEAAAGGRLSEAER